MPRTAQTSIKQNVIHQLNWDQRIDAANIEVDTHGGVVELSGYVPSHMMRRAAEETALNVLGSTAVNNQIKVRRDPSLQVPTDAEIESSLRLLLGWHALIDASDIHITVDAGWVTLAGTVDAYWKNQHIERILGELTGITGLTNKLAIASREDVADQATAEDILAALDRNTAIDVNHVDVQVEQGVVELFGEVPTLSAYLAANNAATYTFGVVDVNNYLHITAQNA